MNQYVICYSGNKWHSLNITTEEYQESIILNPKNLYITFQVSDFIRHIKSEEKNYVPEIINLESFDKQFYQCGKDILGFNKWHILKTLRRESIVTSQYVIDDMKTFLLKLKIFYESLFSRKEVEQKRFREIEHKINKVILKTALLGVKIDFDLAKTRCEKLHREIYRIKNIFQFEYDIFTPESIDTQIEYLKSKGYPLLKSCGNTISLFRKTDIICNLFYELVRTQQDLKSLVYMTAQFGGKEAVHPYFNGFGTITSRITMKEPSLQNLRKSNRDIIVANNSKRLLYIDYCQYEAGILANMSDDKELIELYNNSDIYDDMVQKILNTDISPENRKIAKILFYRYLYGDNFSYSLELKQDTSRYFSKFKQLTKFKENLVNSSQLDSIVKSIEGNYRILSDENENVWILSHYIQSIASYIFKKAIIDVYENIKTARLLIPLHDGVLYEVDENDYIETEANIKNIFITTLKSVCPLLTNPQAEIKDFHLKKLNSNEG